jgi:hypothetical protein
VIVAALFANLAPMAGATTPVTHLAMVTGGEVAVVAIIFGTMSAVLMPFARAMARRVDRIGAGPQLPVQDIQDRLDRIERAVESIALEVERVSEGQRFVTKLLADKTPSSLPPTRG